MRVHHLNCGTLRPPMAKITVGGELVCHCLLAETNDGLLLVDTGIGLRDIEDPRRRLGRAFCWFTGPRLDPEETALRQILRLGYRPADVRHLLVTHLDLDHAGGIPDFPEATLHLYEPEREAARKPRSRYRPHQFEGAKLDLIPKVLQGDTWFGFTAVRAVADDVMVIPLVGHTRGHIAVAVRDDKGWLLHCGDLYYNSGQLDGGAPFGLRAFQRLIDDDPSRAAENHSRIAALARNHSAELRVFSAHDPSEFRLFA